MPETRLKFPPIFPPSLGDTPPMTRRRLFEVLAIGLGNVMGLILAIPGIAYFLDPLRKTSQAGGFESLARLGQLQVDVPQSFAVIAARQDAWVSYPKEPVGSVWLIRQADGVQPPVIAYTSECPHLGCAVNLGKDGKSFLCPCHNSAFELDGKPTNQVPPRGMDTLEVELSKDEDPQVLVKFERFRTMCKEKTPLG